MASKGFALKLPKDAYLPVLKSEEMQEMLQEVGDGMAASMSASVAARLHSPMRVQDLYVCEAKVGKKTAFAVLHPHTRAAFNVGNKYGAKNL